MPEGGSESKKWREANLLVTPRKPTYYHYKSRAAPAHVRSAFSTYEEVPEGGLRSKKWREANLFVIPRKRSWDLRQCKLTLKYLINKIFPKIGGGTATSPFPNKTLSSKQKWGRFKSLLSQFDFDVSILTLNDTRINPITSAHRGVCVACDGRSRFWTGNLLSKRRLSDTCKI